MTAAYSSAVTDGCHGAAGLDPRAVLRRQRDLPHGREKAEPQERKALGFAHSQRTIEGRRGLITDEARGVKLL